MIDFKGTYSDRLSQLMNVLKIPFIGLSLKGTHKRYVWDSIRLDLHSIPLYYVAHEIGHWIEAEEDRKYPEYGLGTGQDNFSLDVSAIYELDICRKKETSAAIIGAGIVAGIGMDEFRINEACEMVQLLSEDIGDIHNWIIATRNLDLDWMCNYARTKEFKETDWIPLDTLKYEFL